MALDFPLSNGLDHYVMPFCNGNSGFWIMQTGMILTIRGFFDLDWLMPPLMTVGLHALYHSADWVAGFPLAGWKVAPPGYAALFVMVNGMMISQLLTKPMAQIGLLLVAIDGVVWAFRPVPDGVLFAVGRTPQLLLAASNGAFQSYSALSDILSSMTKLRMGKGIEQVDKERC